MGVRLLTSDGPETQGGWGPGRTGTRKYKKKENRPYEKEGSRVYRRRVLVWVLRRAKGAVKK